jgi:putative oxidoreductase
MEDHQTRGISSLPERLLRYSLGIVFVWFGALKLVNATPVTAMIQRTYPPFAVPPLFCALTGFETAVGAMLLVNLWPRLAAVLIIFHLLGTFGVLVFAPHLAFINGFPFLSLDGEFVVKNLVLIAAAVALLFWPVSGAQAEKPTAPPLPLRKTAHVDENAAARPGPLDLEL